jgi:predicted secreted protein
LLGLLFPACADLGGPTGYSLDATVNGGSFVCSTGQCFGLELDVCADAGYRWEYWFSDTTVVEIDSIRFRPKGRPDVCGGMTIQTFHLRAMARGDCTIVLIECRSWEPDEPPIHTVIFTVRVFA